MGTRTATGLSPEFAGLKVHPLTARMACSFNPNGMPFKTRMLAARPSSVTVTSRITVPMNFTFRAALEYCGGGQYMHEGTLAPFAPERTNGGAPAGAFCPGRSAS